jgi:hypothetical protein
MDPTEKKPDPQAPADTPKYDEQFQKIESRLDTLAKNLVDFTAKQVPQATPEPEPEPEPTPEIDPAALMNFFGGDPQETVKAVTHIVEKKFREKEDKDKAVQEKERLEQLRNKERGMANELYVMYPDLKEASSELTKRAEEIMNQKSYLPNIGGILLATQQAANELGIMPATIGGAKHEAKRTVPRGGYNAPDMNDENTVTEEDQLWMKRFPIAANLRDDYQKKYKQYQKESREALETKTKTFAGETKRIFG